MLNLAEMPGGLLAALFGRMITSDITANIDGAILAAHSFTVHAEESEQDYFSVVDDLHQGQGTSAHLGETELTSGLFYTYIVVDVPTLVSNITGCNPKEWLSNDRTLAGQVVYHLLNLLCTITPAAKLGSTAAFGYANFMMVETGGRQPRSLADAFREPCKPQLPNALKALEDKLQKLDKTYGVREERRMLDLQDEEFPSIPKLDLLDLAEWTNSNIINAGQE